MTEEEHYNDDSRSRRVLSLYLYFAFLSSLFSFPSSLSLYICTTAAHSLEKSARSNLRLIFMFYCVSFALCFPSPRLSLAHNCNHDSHSLSRHVLSLDVCLMPRFFPFLLFMSIILCSLQAAGVCWSSSLRLVCFRT
jgi:hypothetical protein